MALVSGSVLFVLLALALAPKPPEPTERRGLGTGPRATTKTQTTGLALGQEQPRKIARSGALAGRAASPTSPPAFTDPLVEGFFPSAPPMPLPPPLPEPPPPPEPPFGASDAGLVE